MRFSQIQMFMLGVILCLGQMASASYEAKCRATMKLASLPSSIKYLKSEKKYQFDAKVEKIEFTQVEGRNDLFGDGCKRKLESALKAGITSHSKEKIQQLKVGDEIYFFYHSWNDRGGAGSTSVHLSPEKG